MTYEDFSVLAMDAQENLCYIADPETYELLYCNKSMRQALGLTCDILGQKCYKVLQGRDDVCDFCTNHLLSTEKFYHWEYYNKIYKKYFLLHDIFIIKDKRKLRLEFATDISEQKKTETELKSKLTLDKTLIRCIQTLSEQKDIQRAINNLLQVICEYYEANRAYIFEFDYTKDIINNTYEWCKSGVSAEIDNLQNIPIKYVNTWLEQFKKVGAFFISSLDAELDPDSPTYQILDQQNIKSLIAVPLFSKDTIIGFLGVDDPTANTDDSELLRSIPLFVQDDLEKRRMITTLERMSFVDELTSLYNRNKYIVALKELESHPPASLGVVYLDVNGLKQANDTYGHEYGDELIVKAASMLRNIFTGNIFLIGGDEFVVLCRDMAQENFESCVASLRDSFKKVNTVSVSIGSSWADKPEDTSQIISQTDRLMYIDKQNYYKSMRADQASHRSEAVKELLNAIAAGQFAVHLQPQVSIADHQILGAEALVRRISPTGELISPAKFIPLYETEGIIRHLDFHVLETVCAMLHDWRTLGLELPIAVNISRITLLEYDIVNEISALCARYSVPPRLICIEVTESIRSMDMDKLASLIHQFRQMGFAVSLDDFGSEYSNLAHLISMDFSEIKFDRSLIRNLTSSSKNRIVVEHAISMCHTLPGIHTLAEGVETTEQLNLLRQYACRHAQGFFFSRPVSIDDFQRLFMDHGRRQWRALQPVTDDCR